MANEARAQDSSVMVVLGGTERYCGAGVAAPYDSRSYLPIWKEQSPRLQLMLKIGHIQGGDGLSDAVSGVA